MSDTEFVYTFSSGGYPDKMVKNLIRSIKSLTRYVDEADITVFHTPPRKQSDREELEQLGVTVVDDQADLPPFALHLFERPKPYVQKWNVTKVNAENVVFLDCDTVVLDDIWEVIEGDFEFKARPAGPDDHLDDWRSMFREFDEEPLDWYPNCGFLVFKDRLHKRVAEDWAEYIERDLPFYHEAYTKEQYALALAVAGHDISKMICQDHVMEWMDGPQSTGTVYHYITGSSVKSKVTGAVRRRVPEQLRYYLRRYQQVST